ncbi:hypothetical protein ACLB1O_18425 [Escherichia coli]
MALVDKAQGNPLTQRIRGVRQVICATATACCCRRSAFGKNFRLKPSQYAIFINGIRRLMKRIFRRIN